MISALLSNKYVRACIFSGLCIGGGSIVLGDEVPYTLETCTHVVSQDSYDKHYRKACEAFLQGYEIGKIIAAKTASETQRKNPRVGTSSSGGSGGNSSSQPGDVVLTSGAILSRKIIIVQVEKSKK